jgi:predicted dehydrogenase
VVVVKFDNGAIATAEANFSAVYGYDVRVEVFGSAGTLLNLSLTLCCYPDPSSLSRCGCECGAL